jgi:hypothetical protein
LASPRLITSAQSPRTPEEAHECSTFWSRTPAAYLAGSAGSIITALSLQIPYETCEDVPHPLTAVLQLRNHARPACSSMRASAGWRASAAQRQRTALHAVVVLTLQCCQSATARALESSTCLRTHPGRRLTSIWTPACPTCAGCRTRSRPTAAAACCPQTHQRPAGATPHCAPENNATLSNDSGGH